MNKSCREKGLRRVDNLQSSLCKNLLLFDELTAAEQCVWNYQKQLDTKGSYIHRHKVSFALLFFFFVLIFEQQ